MLNITNYYRNTGQYYNEVSPHTKQNGHCQKIYNICWRGCGERESSCTTDGNVN